MQKEVLIFFVHILFNNECDYKAFVHLAILHGETFLLQQGQRKINPRVSFRLKPLQCLVRQNEFLVVGVCTEKKGKKHSTPSEAQIVSWGGGGVVL